jgi:phage-related protein
MTPIYFYETEAGNEPVREWLKDLNRVDRKVIGDDLQTVQMGWSLGVIKEPLVKSFGNGLFELRSSLPSRRISRVFFCLHGNEVVLLHAIIKKTEKTPSEELDLAKSRQKTLKTKR